MNKPYAVTKSQSDKLLELHASSEIAISEYLHPTSFWRKLFDNKAKREMRRQHVEAMGIPKVLAILHTIAHYGITENLWDEWVNHSINYDCKDESLAGLVFASVISMNRIDECEIMKEIINEHIAFLSVQNKAAIDEHLNLVKTTLNKDQ